MPIELTESLQKALDAQGSPLRVVDPRTNATYVLVRAEEFSQLARAQGDEGLDMRQVAVLVDRAMSDDDDGDPLLESYQCHGNKP